MSENFWLAVVATIVPSIASISAVIIAIVNGRKSADRAESQHDIMVKVIQKTDDIHALANSQLTAVTNALAVANAKILGLEKLISAMAEKKGV